MGYLDIAKFRSQALQQQQAQHQRALKFAAEQKQQQFMNQQFKQQQFQQQEDMREQEETTASGNMAAMEYLQSMGGSQPQATMPGKGGLTPEAYQRATGQPAAAHPRGRGMTEPPAMSLENITQSIMKQNPSITPQALFTALDKFKPMLAQADKMKLAQVRKQKDTGTDDFVESKNIAGRLYMNAIKQGKNPTEAAAIAAKYKRRGAEETTEVGRAKIGLSREDAFTKTESAIVSMENMAVLVEENIDKALKVMSSWSAGYGALLDFLPESDAGKLNAYLTTVKSNIGFDKLQDMRNNSPTGGALGQVSNFENELLQATLGALDPKQSDVLRENLLIIKKYYPLYLAERRRAFDQDYSKFRPKSAKAPRSMEERRKALRAPEQPGTMTGGMPQGWSVTEVQ